jgi:hypothetical protein
LRQCQYATLSFSLRSLYRICHSQTVSDHKIHESYQPVKIFVSFASRLSYVTSDKRAVYSFRYHWGIHSPFKHHTWLANVKSGTPIVFTGGRSKEAGWKFACSSCGEFEQFIVSPRWSEWLVEWCYSRNHHIPRHSNVRRHICVFLAKLQTKIY